MTLAEAFNYGVYFLSANNIDEPEFKSLCLVCSCAGIKNSDYALHKSDEIIMRRFADMLWRVKSGEPLQYILGKWDFYESEFFVGEGVLIPRPETEELTELVIKSAHKIKNPVVFDLCAGSGCIGISVAKAVKGSHVYCIEKSGEAMKYLLKNSVGIENVDAIKEDIHFLPELPQADIIVSNPPYIKTDDLPKLQNEVQREPKEALDGGKDGLDFYRIIADEWKEKIKDGGFLFLEIGDEQGKDVLKILKNAGFKSPVLIKDTFGNDRIVKAKWK